MIADTENSLTRKEQLFEMLRREIFAAQVKVALDRELGRPTSSKVKKLAAVKMPPRARSHKSSPRASEQESVQETRKERLFEMLRREIFAAQVKVALDRELSRPTSSKVKKLAELKLPPRARRRDLGSVSTAP